MAGDEIMRDAEPEPAAEPSVDVEEDDWDAVNAEGTPELTGTEDAGPEESFDTEDEDEVAATSPHSACNFCSSYPYQLIRIVNISAPAFIASHHIEAKFLVDHRWHLLPQRQRKSHAKKENVSRHRTNTRRISWRS